MSGDEIGDEISTISAISVFYLSIPIHSVSVRFPPSPLFWKSMKVHNVPEACDTNTFAEKRKIRDIHRVSPNFSFWW